MKQTGFDFSINGNARQCDEVTNGPMQPGGHARGVRGAPDAAGPSPWLRFSDVP